jgi:hypothetical protein
MRDHARLTKTSAGQDQRGPSLELTASRCGSLSWERKSVMKLLRTTFKHKVRGKQTEANDFDHFFPASFLYLFLSGNRVP